MNIDVIVATYNGFNHIEEQIYSILNQTYKNITVLIRDDGSTDGTIDILKKISLSDTRVKIVKDDIQSKGVGENFKQLLKHCNSDYVFIADQDDHWQEDKIERLLSFIKRCDQDQPFIAYAPGRVVDSELNPTGELTDYRLKIGKVQDMYLMNGGVQGCAMVINKHLYKLALKTNFHWHMHDQVLSLYAACFGKIYFCESPLFLYRQHDNNVLGFNNSTMKDKIKRYIHLNKDSFLVNYSSYLLFNEFTSLLGNSLDHEIKRDIDCFLVAINKGKLSTFIFILKNKLKLQHSLIRAFLKLVMVRNTIER
ncbi:glycosyltransferase [Erwinia rhapontici]|uniref:glycosyltransferase n=1 Tax=Erwinia rhapontici TaxID=55212 RepID=UPI0014385DD9|nr:glycosyltransferase [Erwinia rhapontici]NKG29777.1 glycosyltransferase [Erwinia rhapontici]